ncbi:hypothetical protein PR048_018252 [Dryococelus australis]|uniref:Uncharacterized protein n=1 Tax=Dryococelus australis TaxID=614101 RepID=A0ABQ9HC53_9NEOP|nr:hypothetical protein PR048_018252 [Dryococelus australis]
MPRMENLELQLHDGNSPPPPPQPKRYPRFWHDYQPTGVILIFEGCSDAAAQFSPPTKANRIRFLAGLLPGISAPAHWTTTTATNFLHYVICNRAYYATTTSWSRRPHMCIATIELRATKRKLAVGRETSQFNDTEMFLISLRKEIDKIPEDLQVQTRIKILDVIYGSQQQSWYRMHNVDPSIRDYFTQPQASNSRTPFSTNNLQHAQSGPSNSLNASRGLGQRDTDWRCPYLEWRIRNGAIPGATPTPLNLSPCAVIGQPLPPPSLSVPASCDDLLAKPASSGGELYGSAVQPHEKCVVLICVCLLASTRMCVLVLLSFYILCLVEFLTDKNIKRTGLVTGLANVQILAARQTVFMLVVRSLAMATVSAAPNAHPGVLGTSQHSPLPSSDWLPELSQAHGLSSAGYLLYRAAGLQPDLVATLHKIRPFDACYSAAHTTGGLRPISKRREPRGKSEAANIILSGYRVDSKCWTTTDMEDNAINYLNCTDRSEFGMRSPPF